ncbi:MAG: ROK family protein [Rhodospirillales bacterium]
MSKVRKDRYWIGFDLGGSKMLAVLYDDSFRILARIRRRTRAQEGAEPGIRRIIEVVGEALAAAGIEPQRLAGIGIGCAGPLDLDRGIALEMPNLGWRKAPLKERLEAAFGCRTVVANDVDAGVYGEYVFGAAAGRRSVVGIFVGTGIGGGAVYQGEIVRGRTGSCMEIGHLPIVRDGPLCGCGRRGCLEAVAGRLAISAAAATAAFRGEAPVLLRSAGTDLSQIRSGALKESINGGDRAVENIVRHAAATIGWAAAGIVNLLRPDAIILGGGLVEDLPKLFQQEFDGALRRQVMPSFNSSLDVVVAALAGDATVKGAAAWARQQVTRGEPQGDA